jgi:hypothetical protein
MVRLNRGSHGVREGPGYRSMNGHRIGRPAGIYVIDMAFAGAPELMIRNDTPCRVG